MPAHFGLDIGSYSIKLLEAEKKGKNYQLLTFGEIKTPASINSDGEKDKIAIIEAIKKLCHSCGVKSKNVVFSLSEAEVFSQVIEFPYLTEPELATAISFEAEQYIPLPLEEVQLEHLILKKPEKEEKTGKIQVLLVAAKKTSLEKRIELIEKAGLIPKAAETETLAFLRCAEWFNKGTSFLLDLGHSTTDLSFTVDGTLGFIRTLSVGGEALTRIVALSLNMEIIQAEQYKTSYGIDFSKLDGKVANAIEKGLKPIIEEIRRGMAFFVEKYPQKSVNLMILGGGGAEMPGLSSYLAKIFGIEVLLINPFSFFIKNPNFPQINGASRFAVAAGLAIREDE